MQHQKLVGKPLFLSFWLVRVRAWNGVEVSWETAPLSSSVSEALALGTEEKEEMFALPLGEFLV